MDKRLDIYLVENGFFSTRTSAQDAIKEKRVYVNNDIINKSSYKIQPNARIKIIDKEHEFVSRGGNKLFYALNQFKINLNDKIVLDIGASTGGFTDVCLQAGAKYVYSIDAGKDQLVQSLKNNPKVNSIEGFNCRYLNKDLFNKKIDFICMDVSFISIKLIIDAIIHSIDPPYECVFLIKPQFEVGKALIGKHGIVKDKKVHKKLLDDFIVYFKEKGFGVLGVMKSQTIGRDGNQEYLIYLSTIKNNKFFDTTKIINS